jgi:transcriptional regulator with XRE-family HTH domain
MKQILAVISKGSIVLPRVYSGGSMELDGVEVAASIRELFAANLQRLLDENGLNQREFAKRLDVNESVVSRWLTKDSFPMESSFDLIRTKFGWEYEEFFRSDGQRIVISGRDVDAILDELAEARGKRIVPMGPS